MAAWPGGPCPDCGEDVPANVLRCISCRAWLNAELSRPEPPVPDWFDLPEIPRTDVALEAPNAGHYVVCPCCQKELRVANRFVGHDVKCKFCSEQFTLNFGNDGQRRVGVYVDCPHCENELRVPRKFLGEIAFCRFCNGRIQLPRDVSPAPADEATAGP